MKQMKLWSRIGIIKKSFIIIFFLFIVMVLVLKIIVSSKVYSVISNDQWITIFTTYFSGTLGGLIALGGISWQLNYEKEEKNKNLKRYLKFSLNKNEKHIVEKLCYLQLYFLFDIEIKKPSGLYEDKTNYLEGFNQKYFDENFESILELKNSEKLISLNEKINELNEMFNIILLNLDNRKKVYDELNDNSILKKIINKYSEVYLSIYKKNTYNRRIELLNEIKVLLEPISRQENSICLKREIDNLIIKLEDKATKLFQLTLEEKLEILIFINKIFYKFIYDESNNQENNLDFYVSYLLAHMDLFLEIKTLIKELNQKEEF